MMVEGSDEVKVFINARCGEGMAGGLTDLVKSGGCIK